MSEPTNWDATPARRTAGATPRRYGNGSGSSANLADVLERVLDKGVVIAGDIQINLLDIELLTIKLRLLVASVDKAKEMGIDWWEQDPTLSSKARRRSLEDENRELRDRIEELESGSTPELADGDSPESGERRERGDDREEGR